MIVSIIFFILFLVGFIYVGKMNFKKDEPTDSEKFITEHKEVKEDNVFVYLNSQDAYSYIKSMPLQKRQFSYHIILDELFRVIRHCKVAAIAFFASNK